MYYTKTAGNFLNSGVGRLVIKYNVMASLGGQFKHFYEMLAFGVRQSWII